MPPPTRPLPLNRTLLKILVNGLFIPSAILALALIGLNAYLNARYLGQEQLQLTRSMALRLDDFLRHAVDALNSTAEISRTSTLDETQVHLDGMRVNNPYFNSLYIFRWGSKGYCHQPAGSAVSGFGYVKPGLLPPARSTPDNQYLASFHFFADRAIDRVPEPDHAQRLCDCRRVEPG